MQGKAALMVFVTLGSPDNFSQNKRVESIKVARLDPGSTPGGSTSDCKKRHPIGCRFLWIVLCVSIICSFQMPVQNLSAGHLYPQFLQLRV